MGQQQLLLIILGVIIVGIAIAVGLSLFSAQSVQANKDAIVNDLNNLAANAYQYRIRPTSMGGGGNNYTGFTIPSKLATNENGNYTTSTVSAASVTFVGNSQSSSTNTVSSYYRYGWTSDCRILVLRLEISSKILYTPGYYPDRFPAVGIFFARFLNGTFSFLSRLYTQRTDGGFIRRFL